MQNNSLRLDNNYTNFPTSLSVSGDIEIDGGRLYINNNLVSDGISLSSTDLACTNLLATNITSTDFKTTNVTCTTLNVTGNKINTLLIPTTEIKDDEEIIHTGKSYITYGSGYVDSLLGLSNALLILNSQLSRIC